MGGAFGKLAEKIRRNRKLEIAVYAAIALCAVLIYLSGNSCSAGIDGEATSDEARLGSAEMALEARLEEVLAVIEGVEAVDVMVTCSELRDDSVEVGVFETNAPAQWLDYRVNGVIVVARGAS
ncbi:MAG: hypothetical protein Q4B99_06355, partial [Clostridia bacterium]|nr:hypothetical protein [Clostridia bacterium]